MPEPHREPSITINGVQLSIAQAMSVRVACSNFLIFVDDQLQNEPDDALWQGYRARMHEVVALLQSQEFPV
jgi:hypothetical protein